MGEFNYTQGQIKDGTIASLFIHRINLELGNRKTLEQLLL